MIGESESNFTAVNADSLLGGAFAAELAARSPYSFTAENVYASALVELFGEPVLAPGGSLSGRLSVRLKNLPEQKRFLLRWLLPDGWQADGGKTVYAQHEDRYASVDFTITAGARVEPVNRLILELTSAGRPTPPAHSGHHIELSESGPRYSSPGAWGGAEVRMHLRSVFVHTTSAALPISAIQP